MIHLVGQCCSAVSKLYIFLQFSDVLVYGSRLPPPKLQFKVHGQLALYNIDVSTPSDVYDFHTYIVEHYYCAYLYMLCQLMY